MTQERPSTVEPSKQEHTSPQDGLSIVIPAYNEENGIAPVLEELFAELAELEVGIPIEVIVVDDGSKDKTVEKLEALELEGLRLMKHPVNRGYGAALKTGIRQAAYPWILITDADGTYPNKFIPDILKDRDQYDMIVGARIGENANIPLIRRPPKWVLRKLASVLSGRNIPDLNSGFRLMRKEVVERFFHLLPQGFSFTTTITLAMISSGYRVHYTTIDYHKRVGSSKIRPIADTLNFLKLILRTVMYFDPLRVFLPVSVLFFLSGIGVGVVSILAGKFMDVTTVLLSLTGIHMLALGMLADTLNRRLE